MQTKKLKRSEVARTGGGASPTKGRAQKLKPLFQREDRAKQSRQNAQKNKLITQLL